MAAGKVLADARRVPRGAPFAAAKALAVPVDRAAAVPRAVRIVKASTAGDCTQLEQLPNIGPSMAADLRSLGIEHPGQLAAFDGLALYQALCRRTGQRQDACVLDTFLAATDFMRGAPSAPWWHYTAERKRRHGVLPDTGLGAQLP